jgi:hypothetical protein
MSKNTKHEARTFFADTRFERMARRPGGVTREQAVARAQTQIDEIKAEFPEWLNLKLQELSAAIKQAEGSSFDSSWHERAYGISCQLRDVGATMGYELVSYIANNLCKILDAIKAGVAYDREMINCHVDALFLARTEQYRHLRPEQVPEMASGLRRVAELVSIVPAQKNK